MIILNINRNSGESLYQQIVEQIMTMIQEGHLKAGEALPSSRILAEKNGINRTTVTRAYEELWAGGYLESQPGSYTRVRYAKYTSVKEKNSSSINWTKRYKGVFKTELDVCEEKKSNNNAGKLDFASLSPDPKIMPIEEFRKILNHTLRVKSSEVLAYGDPAGYVPLRKEIARHMELHGVRTNYHNIIITNGIHHAIDLIFRLFTSPGDKIIVERPTYSEILTLLEYHRLQPVEVPMTEDGMDLDILREKIETEAPVLIYTIPNFHSPTGITTSQVHRERLISICEKYEVPLIEDAFSEDMKYFGRQIMPLKAIDQKQLVFYTGTFSKFLFPGIRIGWIVAHRDCICQLTAMYKSFQIAGNLPVQAALKEFCQSGGLDKHLVRIHKVYRKRMHAALSMCRQFFDDEKVSFTKPRGGYSIWFTVKDINEKTLTDNLEDEGVLVSPGSIFFATPAIGASFRLSIAHRTETEIENGIKRIKKVIDNELYKCL